MDQSRGQSLAASEAWVSAGLVDPWLQMTGALDTVLEALRAHEPELRRFGVSQASVFGSVARGEARADSGVDVLVELDQNRPMGIFEYARRGEPQDAQAATP
ncbi:hypothetical protein SBA4_2270012 [Candidatus Sulfopaludibacter sp. SbA4]|nr:hypothetical protein SBA4_2270012 [Candidatus Sulfopaludibacter sp. SbA4]